MDFSCIKDCSQCCIEREYYPSKKFGKIGVLILPEEKKRIEDLATKNGIQISIIPRIGLSNVKSEKPEKVLAYQMMGIEKNGNTCPFLDTESGKKSPHGGHPCKIYENRPLACSAYPVIESVPIQLDSKCKFCQEHGSTDNNLNSEIESLVKIKNKMETEDQFVWRYATGIGEQEDKEEFQSGWILEEK
jgi:uncharacterized protein